MSAPPLTVPEVAAKWRCSERFVLDEIRRKKLRATKIAGSWRIYESDVETYAEAHMNVSKVRRPA